MIGRIWALASNTFRDAIRHRVLVGIVFVVFGLNIFAVILGEMSLHQEARVAIDLGLGGVSLFGSVTAISLGVMLLTTEIKRRTIHTIISKPIERYEFVLGKYFGMCITLSFLVSLFSAAMVLLLLFQDVSITVSIVKALVLAYWEVVVVAAIAVFFSSFSTPYFSGILTFGVFAVGRLTPEIRATLASMDLDLMKRVLSLLLYALPDLHLFSVSGGNISGKSVSVHGEFVTWGYVVSASAYGFLCIAILLGFSMIIFSRRDFV